MQRFSSKQKISGVTLHVCFLLHWRTLPIAVTMHSPFWYCTLVITPIPYKPNMKTTKYHLAQQIGFLDWAVVWKKKPRKKKQVWLRNQFQLSSSPLHYSPGSGMSLCSLLGPTSAAQPLPTSCSQPHSALLGSHSMVSGVTEVHAVL